MVGVCENTRPSEMTTDERICMLLLANSILGVNIRRHDQLPRVLMKFVSFGSCEAHVRQLRSTLRPFPSSLHIGGGWIWRCRHEIMNSHSSLPGRDEVLVAESPWCEISCCCGYLLLLLRGVV